MTKEKKNSREASLVLLKLAFKELGFKTDIEEPNQWIWSYENRL